MSAGNIHATAVVLGDRGILIAGPSGAGKTTLALALVAAFGQAGRFARLVADDRVLVEARAGRLVVACPAAIAGLAEVYGLGPSAVQHLDSAVIDLAVRLVDRREAPRLSDPAEERFAGVAVPVLALPARNAPACVLAVTAWLDAPALRGSDRPRSGLKCVNLAKGRAEWGLSTGLRSTR